MKEWIDPYAYPARATGTEEPVQHEHPRDATHDELVTMVNDLSDILERVGIEAEGELEHEFKVMVDRWTMRGRALVGNAPDGFNLAEHEISLNEDMATRLINEVIEEERDENNLPPAR